MHSTDKYLLIQQAGLGTFCYMFTRDAINELSEIDTRFCELMHNLCTMRAHTQGVSNEVLHRVATQRQPNDELSQVGLYYNLRAQARVL